MMCSLPLADFVMQNSTENFKFVRLGFHSRKKLRGADRELLPFPLENDGGFAGGERCPPLHDVWLALKGHRHAGRVKAQSFVIRLRIDLFHGSIS